MLNTRENVSRLWQARSGLIILLIAGGLICLLAVLAPQAWATPDQKPMADTTTKIDGNPDPPECLLQCAGPVMLETWDDGFGAGVTVDDVDVYVTLNITWTLGVTSIGDPEVVVVHQTTVDLVNGHFHPDNPALIWDLPQAGYYDVFFDVNKDGTLNDGDGLLGPEGSGPAQPIWVGAGICVDECAVGGATVPSERRLWLLGVAFVALIGVGTGANLAWRRLRS
jgi:hypothetical protein